MTGTSDIRTVNVTRYVTPLREGGSLPAIVEADDDFLYVLKFRGAGQGSKALIAEFIGGEIARRIGLKVPEIVFANLDSAFGRMEGDEEIQDLLKGSTGLNLGLHYLSGSITYDPIAVRIAAPLASTIVWLDCLLMNVDRTFKNTNMLWWNKELWLIDHGAALYFHHGWQDADPLKRFPYVKDHVLLSQASMLDEVNEPLRSVLTNEFIRSVTAAIPDDWLTSDAPFETKALHRQAYAHFLETRIVNSNLFVKEAQDARQAIV